MKKQKKVDWTPFRKKLDAQDERIRAAAQKMLDGLKQAGSSTSSGVN